jgi:ribonuclease E
VEVAAYLLNEKRRSLSEIENRHRIDIILIPNPHLETPHFDIQRVRKSDKEEMGIASFDLVQMPATEEATAQPVQAARPEEPAVKTFIPQGPAPMREEKVKKPEGSGFIRKLFSTLFGNGEEPKEKKAGKSTEDKRSQQRDKGSRAQGGRRSQAQGQGQGQRQGQSPRRRGRKTGGKQQQAKTADSATTTATEKKPQEQQKASGSRRGRRGGRRRRDDGQGKTANSANKQQAGTGETSAAMNTKDNQADRQAATKTPQDKNVSAPPVASENKPAAAPSPAPATEQNKPAAAESTPVIRPTAAGNSVIQHPAGQKQAAEPQAAPAPKPPAQPAAPKPVESQSTVAQEKTPPATATEQTQKPAKADKSLTMVETRPELVKQPEAGGESSS